MIQALVQMRMFTRDLPQSVFFYTKVLGLSGEWRGPHRLVLTAGTTLLELCDDRADVPLRPRNDLAYGGQNFCFRAQGNPDKMVAYLQSAGAKLVEDAIHTRQGAIGAIRSIYLLDPDCNLVEIGVYEPSDLAFQITGMDHVVLIAEDLQQAMAFYKQELHLTGDGFDGHGVVEFGVQKMNIHEKYPRYRPHEPYAAKGCLSLTFYVSGDASPAEPVLYDPDGNCICFVTGQEGG